MRSPRNTTEEQSPPTATREKACIVTRPSTAKNKERKKNRITFFKRVKCYTSQYITISEVQHLKRLLCYTKIALYTFNKSSHWQEDKSNAICEYSQYTCLSELTLTRSSSCSFLGGTIVSLNFQDLYFMSTMLKVKPIVKVKFISPGEEESPKKL